MTTTQGRAIGIPTLPLLAGIGVILLATAPASAEDITADAFAKGGTFCFDIGSGRDGDHQHFKLVTEAAVSPGPYDVIEVHGIEKGALQNVKYVNGLAGTATLAPSSAPNVTGDTLHISLMGNGNSIRKDGGQELWTLQYSLELSPATMTGTFYGYAIQSTAVTEGGDYAAENTFYVLREAKPMSCEAL